MRTDFKVVATQATIAYGGGSHGLVKIWMKNIGTASIGNGEISQSDVFIGKVGDFQRAIFFQGSTTPPAPLPPDDSWSYYFDDINTNNQWDPGETLEIDAMSIKLAPAGVGITYNVYFQFVLRNGVWRSTEFTAS
jgi:hypothetical protein